MLEREAELAAIDAAIASARAGRGTVVWIEGPAGIGKTQLLEAAGELGRTDGLMVLGARASELEKDYAYSVVRSLFEPAVVRATPARRAELLSGAAGLAAPVLMLERFVPSSMDTAQLEPLHGLYWLTVHLADTAPLLLVIDDLQWADPASVRALAYLARRVADLPVALAVSIRTTEPEGFGSILDAVRGEPITVAVRPAPLSPAATAGLVRRILGESAEPTFIGACHEATGGNPLLLRSLLEALHDAAIHPDSAAIEAVRQRAPAIMATLVMPRLRHVSSSAVTVARAVAILGSGAQLRHVAALAGLDAQETANGADELVSAELMVAGRPLSFTHSLVPEVITQRMPAAEVHRLHLSAARLLAVDGSDPERVAAHLLATEPLGDDWVVGRLREAAQSAAAKGAPQVAGAYLRRALEEPPEARARPEVLLEYGAAQSILSVPQGLDALREALATAEDPQLRGRIALEMAKALQVATDYHQAFEVVRAAIDRLDGDPQLRLELEAELVGIARRDPELRPMAVARARQLHQTEAVNGRAGARLLSDLALETLQQEGAASAAVDLATRALAVRPIGAGLVLMATMVLRSTDDLDAALTASDNGVADARARGSLLDFAACTANRAFVLHQLGSLRDAEADARRADELVDEVEADIARRYSQAALVQVLVDRGDLVAADESLERSGVSMTLVYLLHARGRLRLAQGRHADALDDLRACGERLARRGIRHPGLVPWQADAALASHQLGDGGLAASLIAEADDLARWFDARRPLGLAMRARGLIEDRIDCLEDAVSVLESTPARLEHARAVIDLGAALRRANQRSSARERLRLGLDLAHRCGADTLVDHARQELACTGARPRRPRLTGIDALTASERRVAQMAAQGLSNRDVAQALFVSAKTVETHLGSAYRKLGITGRPELAAALG